MNSLPATLPEPSRSASPAACPSDEELLAYLPGELSGPKADSIASHLATCVLCQSRVSTLKQRISDREAHASAAAGSDSPTTLLQELRPRPPQRLGEYELLAPIGRGGMGVVYRARHVRLQRVVAIKVLPRLELADDSAIVRMQRESAAAGRVRHPNIVYATDAGESEGIHYLVMELVTGVDLSKLVAALGPLPVAEACEIVRQAALGLAHIAECSLVHRDLKPSNVMLAEDGTVKILDLGLARVHHNALEDSEPTQAGYLLGTADYIAPEQIDSPHDADVRSDLYSLGCTFFKLLTGSAPYSGLDLNSVSRKVEAHRRSPPPAICQVRPDVPPAVEQLLLKLLAKRPADRYQHPQELADALAPLARGANLRDLAARLGQRGAFDALPVDPLQTPVSTNATTQSMMPSPPPARRRSGPLNWSAVALAAVAVFAGAWAIYLAWNAGNRPSGVVKPGNNAVVYDVSAPLAEVPWIGHLWSPPPFYKHDRKMLEVRPDTFQLIELGQYDGRPGTFTATISQAIWHGDVGLFFGCRPEPRFGRPELTTFQLFLLEHFPAAGTGAGAVDELFRVSRQRAIIKVNPIDFGQDLDTIFGQDFPRPAGSQITMEITFSRERCERVRINGHALDELTTAAVNANYLPEDYRGTFGLYCTAAEVDAVGGNRLGPTWFGNIVFAPAE